MRAFEQSAGVAPVPSPASGRPSAAGTVSIWSPALRTRTAALWVVWFCINLSYYGAFIWLPTLLSGELKDLSRSFLYTLIITLAQLPGYAVAAYLIEKWGRRPTLATFLAGSAVGAVVFGMVGSGVITVASGRDVQLIAARCVLSFFNLGAWGALYAVGPEIYPTGIRGTGTGAAAAFGRIAAMIAPLLVPLMLAAGGFGLVFAVFGGAFLIAAGAALALPENRGEALQS